MIVQYKDNNGSGPKWNAPVIRVVSRKALCPTWCDPYVSIDAGLTDGDTGLTIYTASSSTSAAKENTQAPV